MTERCGTGDKGRKAVAVICACGILLLTSGCEAFVRKFTRKPKKEAVPEAELVLVPEKYSPAAVSAVDQARQLYIFWKTWHGELTEALREKGNHKKRMGCVNEAVKNLSGLRAFLYEEKQNKIGNQLAALEALGVDIKADLYGSEAAKHLRRAESIRRSVERELPYSKFASFVKTAQQ